VIGTEDRSVRFALELQAPGAVRSKVSLVQAHNQDLVQAGGQTEGGGASEMQSSLPRLP
jgi:hypothetical protein